MKKSILKLGKTLNKVEQTEINGGTIGPSFPCYCNGRYVGQVSSIEECWNACPGVAIK